MALDKLFEVGVSLFGAKKGSDAAKEQVKLANEAKDRQHEYDLELYKMNQDKISADRQQAIDSIMTQAENEK